MKKTTRSILILSLMIFAIHLNAQTIYQTTSDLKLRSGPGIKYKSIGIIKIGEKINVIEKTNMTWFKIDYNGKTGFLSSKLIVPVVETPKIEETPNIESEPTKSNTAFPYIIGAIAFLILLVIFSSRNTKKKAHNTQTLSRERDDLHLTPKNKDQIIKGILKNIKIEVTTTDSKNSNTDESIIDVTGNGYNLMNDSSNLLKHAEGVPVWKHQYVYSSSEINGATGEQIKFYNYFKYCFLKGEYLDIEGNSNYSFILLFDLIDDYENHRNLLMVERQLEELGECFPKTKSYALSSLINKLQQIGDSEAITQLRNRQNNSFTYQQTRSNSGNSFDGNYWGLGTKYKSKLNLNDEDVELLNRLWYPTNNFCSIEFCCLEIINLYLSTIKSLKQKCIQEQTTLKQLLTSVVDIILRKHFRYQLNSFNYKNSIESTTTEIYSNIFKRCENAVREHYNHKRKINTDTYFTTSEAKNEFETKIISRIIEILPSEVLKIKLPDEATQIELYSQNTSRWKIKFEEYIANHKGNTKEFIDSILSLANLNKRNPSIENIFFEASKFISKFDKEAALTLYVYYLYYDLKSASFDNKQLTKTIQKSLFKTNEQLHDFEVIVGELVKDKSLEKALRGVSGIYTIKRKKIQIDSVAIEEVQQQHSGTVELLNEYLKDEYEDEYNTIKTQELNNDEIEIEITQKIEGAESSIYTNDVAFTQIHTSTLDFFTKSNFTVLQNDLEVFAKSKGIFRNQLIESINDLCYEKFDDILIEDEEDYYILNQSYYQSLLAK